VSGVKNLIIMNISRYLLSFKIVKKKIAVCFEIKIAKAALCVRRSHIYYHHYQSLK
jgi:hypothetical protein